jgi:hypothetical protein
VLRGADEKEVGRWLMVSEIAVEVLLGRIVTFG